MKANARTKGAGGSDCSRVEQEIGGSVENEDQLSPNVLQRRPVVGRDVFENRSWSRASAFEKKLESKRATLRFADPVVATFLLSELPARDWAKRAMCGHGEATVVVVGFGLQRLTVSNCSRRLARGTDGDSMRKFSETLQNVGTHLLRN